MDRSAQLRLESSLPFVWEGTSRVIHANLLNRLPRAAGQPRRRSLGLAGLAGPQSP
jgi:hypothetical protein